MECFVSTVSQRILRNESFNHKSSIILGNSFIETRLSRLKKEWHLLGASIPPVILISQGFQSYTSVTVVFLYSPLIVNGDLAGSRKSSLLVEDFIKVDVLLVKVCHKRRKVNWGILNKSRCFELRLRENIFLVLQYQKEKNSVQKTGSVKMAFLSKV